MGRRMWREGCGRCMPIQKKTDNDDSKVELFAIRFCIFSVRSRLRRSQVRRFDGLAIPPPTYSADAIGGGEYDDSNVESFAARFYLFPVQDRLRRGHVRVRGRGP